MICYDDFATIADARFSSLHNSEARVRLYARILNRVYGPWGFRVQVRVLCLSILGVGGQLGRKRNLENVPSWDIICNTNCMDVPIRSRFRSPQPRILQVARSATVSLLTPHEHLNPAAAHRQHPKPKHKRHRAPLGLKPSAGLHPRHQHRN